MIEVFESPVNDRRLILLDGPTFAALKAAVEVAFEDEPPDHLQPHADLIWSAFFSRQPRRNPA